MARDGVILQNPRVHRRIGAAQVLPQSLCHVNKHSHLCGMLKPGESSAMEQLGSVSSNASELLRTQRANAANNTTGCAAVYQPALLSVLSCLLPNFRASCRTQYHKAQHATCPYPKPSHTPIFTYFLHATSRGPNSAGPTSNRTYLYLVPQY